MAASWQKAVGNNLGTRYWRPKGRDVAQSEFLMDLNARMQAKNPGGVANVNDVETLRRELEPQVIADVQRRHPGFAPKRIAN